MHITVTMRTILPLFSLLLICTQLPGPTLLQGQNPQHVMATQGQNSPKELQTQGQNPPQEVFDIYLLIGQSNMAGRAAVIGTLADPQADVWLYKGKPDSAWVPAANPLNRYSSIRKELDLQRLGPGYGFAAAVREANPDRVIGLVVNAQGGTSIRQWSPDELFYREAVDRAKAAERFGTLRGVLWHQGESDLADLADYMDRLEEMIHALRRDLNRPDLPFVAGELYYGLSNARAFNTLLATLPDRVPATGVASAFGLTAFDRLHFDTASQLMLGRRYATALQGIRGEEPD